LYETHIWNFVIRNSFVGISPLFFPTLPYAFPLSSFLVSQFGPPRSVPRFFARQSNLPALVSGLLGARSPFRPRKPGSPFCPLFRSLTRCCSPMRPVLWVRTTSHLFYFFLRQAFYSNDFSPRTFSWPSSHPFDSNKRDVQGLLR